MSRPVRSNPKACRPILLMLGLGVIHGLVLGLIGATLILVLLEPFPSRNN